MYFLVIKFKYLMSEYDYIDSLFDFVFMFIIISISGINGKIIMIEMIIMFLEDFKVVSGGNIGMFLIELFEK